MAVVWFMFSYHEVNGPESSMTLCLERVCQVAVPVGCQDNYSVWSSSSECGTRAKSATYNCLVFGCMLSVDKNSEDACVM